MFCLHGTLSSITEHNVEMFVIQALQFDMEELVGFNKDVLISLNVCSCSCLYSLQHYMSLCNSYPVAETVGI